jgi:hypothetical protein
MRGWVPRLASWYGSHLYSERLTIAEHLGWWQFLHDRHQNNRLTYDRRTFTEIPEIEKCAQTQDCFGKEIIDLSNFSGVHSPTIQMATFHQEVRTVGLKCELCDLNTVARRTSCEHGGSELKYTDEDEPQREIANTSFYGYKLALYLVIARIAR